MQKKRSAADTPERLIFRNKADLPRQIGSFALSVRRYLIRIGSSAAAVAVIVTAVSAVVVTAGIVIAAAEPEEEKDDDYPTAAAISKIKSTVHKKRSL